MILASLFKRSSQSRERIVCFLRSLTLSVFFFILLLSLSFCVTSEALLKEAPNDTETETSEIYLIDETPQSEINPVEYTTEETENHNNSNVSNINDSNGYETDITTESDVVTSETTYDNETTYNETTDNGTTDTEINEAVTDNEEGTETSVEESTETLPPVDEKVVYLTFDDGPSKKYTETILDILNAHEIKATFFVIGQNAKNYPSIVRRIVDEGHALGCHSMTHDIKRIYKSVERFKSEIDDWEETINNILGDLPPKKLIRLPGGSTTASRYVDSGEKIISYIKERGYYIYDWSAANGDKWEGARREDESIDDYLRRMIIETTESCIKRGKKPCVVLVHDSSYDTFLMIDWALTELQKRGYVFKTLYELDESFIF